MGHDQGMQRWQVRPARYWGRPKKIGAVLWSSGLSRMTRLEF